MLRFKSWRKSPALTQETTPSQRRITRILSEAQQAAAREMDAALPQVAEALSRGQVDRVLSMLPTEPWLEAQEALAEELLGELLDAGSRVQLPTIEKATAEFSFDRGRPESAQWARYWAGALITQITYDQREVVRNIVSVAASGTTATPYGGIPFPGQRPVDWTQVARTVRGTIGLTTQQAGWVANHYDRAYTAAIQGGASSAQAAALAARSADRYQTSVHRYRANTIARTETMRAASEGRVQAWNQGMAQGFIDPLWQKEWIAESDACPMCLSIDGKRIGVKDSFPVGEPPAHPNCRCDVLLVPPKAQPPQAPAAFPTDLLPFSDLFSTGPAPGLPNIPAPDTSVFIGMPRVLTFASILEQADDLADAAGDWRNSLEGDPFLAQVYKARGYDALPTVVDSDAFDTLLTDGATVLYRGLYGDGAQGYLDEFRYGTYFAGRGISGNGTYAGVQARVAVSYGQGRLSNVMRLALADGSRVITDDDLLKEWLEFLSSPAYDALTPAGRSLVGDMGRYAAARGYDAIRVSRSEDGDSDYFVILNRGRVTVDRNNGLGSGVVSREELQEEWGEWLVSPAFDALDREAQIRFTDVNYYAASRGYTAVFERNGDFKDLTWIRDRYLTGDS